MFNLARAVAALLACAVLSPASALAFDHSFIGQFSTITPVGSTVPSNGDENPYGIVNVPSSVGSLVRGDIAHQQLQRFAKTSRATGTTIVQLTPSGSLSRVRSDQHRRPSPAPCPGGVGLTTALAILPDGYVVVGSLPTANGMAATA